MKPWFLLVVLFFPLLAFADTISVPYQQTKTILIAGATAAFSLNSDYVEASVKGGALTLYGKGPGTTTVIVVTSSGTQSLQVDVPLPPPIYPPGFEKPLSANAANEKGSYEVRYASSPGQLQNNLDFSQQQGDRTIHFFLGNVNFFSTSPGVSTVSFPLMYYQIATPRKEVTFVDQYTTVSPLTIYDSLLRGIHVRDGGWFYHFGYTSLSAFQNLFLPTGRQLATGGGYKFSLGGHAKLTPSLFYLGNVNNGLGIAQPGGIGSLLFEDKPSDALSYSAELGVSHGVGGSGQLNYVSQQTNVAANFQYEPRRFATLATRNQHGIYSNANGFHNLTEKLRADLFFTGNRYEFPQFTQDNLSSALNLHYQIDKKWSVVGGAAYSYFNTVNSSTPSVRSVNLPAGASFDSKHFGNDFLYTYSINGGQNQGGNEFRDTLRVSRGQFQWSGFADHQTQAPSISFIFQEIPGLEQALEELGITATSPEQIAQLLQTDSSLISLGFIQGLTVNLSPNRLQAGSTFSWLEQGGYHQQVNLNFLYTSLQALSSSEQSVIESATYSRKLSPTNTLWASYSLFRSRQPGSSSSYQSQAEVSLRHQFYSAPRFIIPSRHGNISGVVFKDEKAEGVFQSGMEGLPGVQITLDGVRQVRTDRLGMYSFTNLPYGSHTVEARFESARPFFYTTPSQATVPVNSAVNFGVGYSLSEIFGHVLNDAGAGLLGIQVEVGGRGKVFNLTTGMGGDFEARGLVPGEYQVKLSPDSFPAGYAIADLKPQSVVATADSPGRVTFKVRAYRSISGHATVYDRSLSAPAPVPGLTIRLKGTTLTNTTNSAGIYIFRNLPAGTFTVAATFRGREFTRDVTLPPEAAFPHDIDLNLGAVDKFNPELVPKEPEAPSPPPGPKK
ncbi:MAG: carboxypeptidase regulatory-like domain-containing protein [Terriglobia bacterium]|jgi:hypothetical protein